MWPYVLGRLLLAAGTLLGLTLLVFICLRVIPGDIATIVLGEDARSSPEQVDELRHRLGLDRSLPVQYMDWLGSAVKGDMGQSLFTARSVTREIKSRLSTTMELAVLSLTLTLMIGIPMGILGAALGNGVRSQALRGLSLLGLALPNFWLGTIIIVFAARWFGWIPPVGHIEIWQSPVRNLEQFIVPALVLAFALSATLARMTRSAVLETMTEDFVRTSRAKGLKSSAVWLRHTLRPSLVPILTLFGVQVGAVVGGSVIIENVFALPGLGRLVLDSISRKDLPLVQGIILLYGAMVIFINLSIDLLYCLIDPRIRIHSAVSRS